MRTGRPPVPTELHKLRGTYRPSRHDKRAVAAATPGELSATAPSWMSESQADIWRHAIENSPPALVKPIDGELLAAWCCAADQHRVAMTQQNERDRDSPWPLLTGNQERLTVSLYVKIANEAALRMVRCASELGFSPVSRPRQAAPANAEDEAVDRFWGQFRMGREA